MSPQAEIRRGNTERNIEQLVRDFESGELYPDDLSPGLLERLRQLLDAPDDAP
ncbi:hypothetical protein DSM43518_05628 [Mycobacterium marinum]|uniref:hypothetical protein n=1 Tax=Mycobacterium marinum TaxID=1781 RepID=UPI000EE4F762|nr:hypothetical protein [Mycobacterium marinum]RFZ01135.1 hypothetical protein DSM43518_05628 [Mycobacterium marinum]